MFLMIAVAFVISTPIVGYLIDRKLVSQTVDTCNYFIVRNKMA